MKLVHLNKKNLLPCDTEETNQLNLHTAMLEEIAIAMKMNVKLI